MRDIAQTWLIRFCWKFHRRYRFDVFRATLLYARSNAEDTWRHWRDHRPSKESRPYWCDLPATAAKFGQSGIRHSASSNIIDMRIAMRLRGRVCWWTRRASSARARSRRMNLAYWHLRNYGGNCEKLASLGRCQT